MAHVRGITQFYLPFIRLSMSGMNHPAFTPWALTRWRHASEVAHIQLQLTAHLSTLKRWKAELAWLSDLVADGLPT